MEDQKKWQLFAERYGLSDRQKKQFQAYYELLVEWNKKINLTALTSLDDVLAYHFSDSLEIARHVSLDSCRMLADVGTGGGLPGLALKIKYPQLPLVLIEVVQKKCTFLQHVVEQLGFENVTISSLDWRTFIRSTDYPIDLFCARASLRPDELVRIFKPNCVYDNATVVYWAANEWMPSKKDERFLEREVAYTVGLKKRKYIFFKNIVKN